jgi:glucose/arabinose dehydrogenase
MAIAASWFGAAGVSLAEFEVVRVASGLSQPVYVTAAPGDNSRLFILEANSGFSGGPQIARIKILNLTGPNAGTVNTTPFLEISGIPQVEDQGLFGMVFHPNYETNGIFYINYVVGQAGGTSYVKRFQVSGDPNVANPASETTIFSYMKPYLNHSGDWLGFNPMETAEGKFYLYHTTGDGGDNLDPGNRAQDTSLPYGKVLRFDVGADGLADTNPDANKNYAIPPDNPGFAEPLVWDYGLRNPWRASFDRETGDLYIGNVGGNNVDEVELHLDGESGGVNYGWNKKEGTLNGPNQTPPPITGDRNPMYQKIHNGDFYSGPDRSITGGYVYRGPVEELDGHYIFADFLGDYSFGTGQGKAQIFSLQYDGSAPSTFNGSNIVNDTVLNRTNEFTPSDGNVINFISSFGEDAAGNLYIIDMGNLGTPTSSPNKPGEIYQIMKVVDLKLTVDRSTGEMTWTNNTGSPVDIEGYYLKSNSGAIDSSNLISITENYDFDDGGSIDDNDVWQFVSTSNSLYAEESTGDAGSFGASSMTPAGDPDAWVQSIYEDLSATVLLPGGATAIARVEFVGNGGVPFDRSDLDFDGELDPDDWDVFKANHQNVPGGLTAAMSYQLGDLDGDGDSDFSDFRIFKLDYITANGAAAFAGLNGSSIPEPGSLILALAATLGILVARRRRHA